MPVTGPLVRGFDARAGPYGPGHRGIDIAAPVGELVRAPTAGRVVFAGPVAGVNWVTLMAAPGVLVTLGPLLDPAVTATRVRSRTPVGRVGPGHPAGPAAPATLHLSVRVDGVYVDPLALPGRPAETAAGSAAGSWWSARRVILGRGLGGLCYRPRRARVSGLQRTPVDGTRRCPLRVDPSGSRSRPPTI